MQAAPTFDMIPADVASGASRGLTQLGSFSLWFGVALVLVTAVYGGLGQTDAAQCLWGFLHIMRAMFAALLLACLLNLRRVRHGHPGALPRAFSPIFINLFTLCIIGLVPFGTLWQDAHFSVQQTTYVTVAGWASSGRLVVDEAGWASLPPGYDHLSTTGAVQLVQTDGVTTVFFPQSDLDGHPAGYFFRSDGQWPRLAAFGLNWRRLRQLSPNWYIGDDGAR